MLLTGFNTPKGSTPFSTSGHDSFRGRDLGFQHPEGLYSLFHRSIPAPSASCASKVSTPRRALLPFPLRTPAWLGGPAETTEVSTPRRALLPFPLEPRHIARLSGRYSFNTPKGSTPFSTRCSRNPLGSSVLSFQHPEGLYSLFHPRTRSPKAASPVSVSTPRRALLPFPPRSRSLACRSIGGFNTPKGSTPFSTNQPQVAAEGHVDQVSTPRRALLPFPRRPRSMRLRKRRRVSTPRRALLPFPPTAGSVQTDGFSAFQHPEGLYSLFHSTFF